MAHALKKLTSYLPVYLAFKELLPNRVSAFADTL